MFRINFYLCHVIISYLLFSFIIFVFVFLLFLLVFSSFCCFPFCLAQAHTSNDQRPNNVDGLIHFSFLARQAQQHWPFFCAFPTTKTPSSSPTWLFPLSHAWPRLNRPSFFPHAWFLQTSPTCKEAHAHEPASPNSRCSLLPSSLTLHFSYIANLHLLLHLMTGDFQHDKSTSLSFPCWALVWSLLQLFRLIPARKQPLICTYPLAGLLSRQPIFFPCAPTLQERIQHITWGHKKPFGK